VPSGPLPFLIVGEVLNLTLKKEVADDRIRGIRLPGVQEDQVIGQYADDTNLTLRAEEQSVINTVASLTRFSGASGLTINWEKTLAYYWRRGFRLRPAWLDQLGWQWAEENEISKLLGTPFGLTLSASSVDQFLLTRTDKQLQYWSNTRINRTGRAVISNAILIGAALFFLSIWGGTQAGVKKLVAKARNYLWAGSAQPARARVAWDVVCLPRQDGGLNMINPKHMVIALMSKWIINACEPGSSKFKALLRHRLEQCQPHARGTWNGSLQWFTRPNFRASSGSRMWNRTMLSWKQVVKDVSLIPPTSYEEWLSSYFWWDTVPDAIGPMFSKQRAAELHNSGLQFVRDAWIEARATMCSTEEAERRFGLTPAEFTSWARICFPLSQTGQRFLIRRSARPSPTEWVGLFPTPDSQAPLIVLQGRDASQGLLNSTTQWLQLTGHHKYYTVLEQSRILVTTPPDATLQPGELRFNGFGFIERVRVQSIFRGPKRNLILLYYGKIKDLSWDPARLQWPRGKELLHYTTQLGRDLLRKRQPQLTLATAKWPTLLPATYRFRWKQIWTPERSKTEAGFIWQLWHKAVALNAWRGRFTPQVDTTCPICQTGAVEDTVHRFWRCEFSQNTWKYVTFALNCIAAPTGARTWSMPNWKQSLFSARPPRRFSKTLRFWELLRGITIWTIWLARNDKVFNHEDWAQERVEQTIWNSLVDYGRSAWVNTVTRLTKDPTSRGKALEKFDHNWGKYPIICSREGMKVTWVCRRPTR
jgi:hypothetical protein